MKTQKILILTLVALSIIFSCGKDDSGTELNFSDLFINTSENIIQPQYQAYKTQSQSLMNATTAFINNATLENLEDLQTLFIDNYKLWQHTSIYEFGPAAGLPAIEYLIYGIDKNNNSVLTSFSTDTDAGNRKVYLTKLVEQIVAKITLASERWVTYHQQFITNKGTGNSSSLTLLFNAYLKDYEETKRNKFALPAGYATEFSIPIAKNPNKLEGKYADISFTLIEESIKAHKAFFQGIGLDGTDGIGFFDKLKEYKATSTIIEGDLADVSLNQMDIILSNLDTYSGSLYTEIQNSNPSLEVTSLELQKLVPLIKIDMKAYFGVPITSQDTDGD